MNKLYLALSVLCVWIHATGWAMLTVSNTSRLYPKKLFTEKFACKHECLALKSSQKFLDSFMQKDFDTLGDEFCALPRSGKARVMRCLDNDQKLLLQMAMHKGIDHYILTELFNGSEKVATMYSQKPIGEILEAYASAKEMMKWCPIFKNGVVGVLKEHHYMTLKDSERIFLADVDKKATIHSADVPQFMSILNILHDVDPETIGIGEIKGITDSIKLDLSLSERGCIFYNMIPQNTFLRICKIVGVVSSMSVIVGSPMRILVGKKCLPILGSIEHMGQVFVLGLPVVYGGSLWDMVPYYHHHLKTNILPNQPSLTDYLKKTAS